VPWPRMDERIPRYVNKMIPRGYAWVSVDVRATGASFGSKACDIMPREVEDFSELVTWVKQQSWCNGNIGTGTSSFAAPMHI